MPVVTSGSAPGMSQQSQFSALSPLAKPRYTRKLTRVVTYARPDSWAVRRRASHATPAYLLFLNSQMRSLVKSRGCHCSWPRVLSTSASSGTVRITIHISNLTLLMMRPKPDLMIRKNVGNDGHSARSLANISALGCGIRHLIHILQLHCRLKRWLAEPTVGL